MPNAAATATAAAPSVLRVNSFICVSPWVGYVNSLLAAFPFAHLLLGVVLRYAVALLDLADQPVPLARQLIELVVGHLAPALLERALELLPVSGNAVPVHRFS